MRSPSRHARRSLNAIAVTAALLALVPLVGRAAPLAPGNLFAVIVTSSTSFPSYVVELTPGGAEVQRIQAPDIGDGFARDAVVDTQGRLLVFEGETRPFLDTLDPLSGVWSSRTLAGWSTNDPYGHAGIALAPGAVLVTDARSGAAPSLSDGLIRFPSTAGSPDRPVVAADYLDVVTGLDGEVYALDAQSGPDGVAIDVFDSGTLARIRRIPLPAGLSAHGVAVDAAGRIFVGSWQTAIHRLSPNGVLEASASLTSLGLSPFPVIDIDVSAEGQLILGGSEGSVAITTTDFDPARTVAVHLGNYAVAMYVGIVPVSGATPVTRSTWGALKSRFR